MKLKIPIDIYQLGAFLEGEFVDVMREPHCSDVMIVECEPIEVIVSRSKITGVPTVKIDKDKEIARTKNAKEANNE